VTWLTPLRTPPNIASLHVFGAIAQLGERLHGMQEVDGSIPSGSTNPLGTAVCLRMRIPTAAAFTLTLLMGALVRFALAALPVDSTANDPSAARGATRDR
jgi:hypothetical protein